MTSSQLLFPTGWYLYLEASSSTYGDSVELESQILMPNLANQETTLSFYYNMFGNDINTLRVWLITDTSSEKIWEVTGNQGQGWNQGCVHIPTQLTSYRVSDVFTYRHS